MAKQDLEDYLILRELDEPVAPETMEQAGEKSGKVVANLQDEGVGIQWVKSEVMMNDDGEITGTFCHYQAEDKDVIKEHAKRAELPATRIDRRGPPVDGE